MTKSRCYIFLAFVALWSLLAAFTPTGTYWRDSGEFILSAFYLDVAHPAGFPLYSQLANLFALIPFGSIAWRVNSFSGFIAAFNLVLLFVVTSELLGSLAGLPKFARILLSLVPPCILGFTAAFLRQSFTAEVYNLNALVILGLTFLYLRYETTRDKRLLIACGFLGGIGLGNHVALAIVLLPAVIIIGSEFRAIKNIIIPAFVAGLVGVSVYAYLPLRAMHQLPLNSGEASSPQRFLNQISDARDRELRKADGSAVDSSIVHLQAVSGAHLARTMSSDLHTMQAESDSALLIAGVCGLLLLIIHRTRVGLLLTCSAGATWFFFLGWDPDPWLPLFIALGIGCAYLAAFALTKFPAQKLQQSALAGAALLAAIVLNSPARAAEDLRLIRSFDLPSSAAAVLLERIPPHSIYMTEASWFLLNYAQAIEGLREDVVLVYQPSILFPEHFARIVLQSGTAEQFDSWAPSPNAQAAGLPQDQNLARFTDWVTRRQTLGFEPNMILNRFFSAIAQCDASGYAYLERGKPADCQPEFSTWYENYLGQIQEASVRSWRGFTADSTHFYETQLTNAAALLRETGSPAIARSLLAAACLKRNPSFCKLTSLNNLATYYMDEGDYRSAAALLRSLQAEYPESAAVQANLAQTLRRPQKESISEVP